MNIEVWSDFVSAQLAEVRDLLADLRERGLSCYPAHPSSGGPGLIFFGHDCDELRARLHERSRGGDERVLAISLAGDALRGGWDLLAAGAADVIRLADPS